MSARLVQHQGDAGVALDTVEDVMEKQSAKRWRQTGDSVLAGVVEVVVKCRCSRMLGFGAQADSDCEPNQSYLDGILQEIHPERIKLLEFTKNIEQETQKIYGTEFRTYRNYFEGYSEHLRILIRT